MKNMKYLIKLFGALALTTGAATSVVACDKASDAPTLDSKYATLLGLNVVNQSLTADFSKVEINTAAAFTISTVKAKFENMINTNGDISSTDTTNIGAFLKELGFTVTADNKCSKEDAAIIRELKLVIKEPTKDVKAGTVAKNTAGTDFIINKGTVKFEVQKKDDTVVKTYSLEVKAIDNLGVPTKFAAFLNANTKLDLNENNSKFVKNGQTSAFKLLFKVSEDTTKYNALLKTLGNPAVTFIFKINGSEITQFTTGSVVNLTIKFGDVTVLTDLSLGTLQ